MLTIIKAGRLALATGAVLNLAAWTRSLVPLSADGSPSRGAGEAKPALCSRDRSGRRVPGTANPYFPLVPGTTYHYTTEDGAELNEIAVTADIKTILGVSIVVVHDRVYLDENGNGEADGASCGADPGFTAELIEETFDWFAQDNKAPSGTSARIKGVRALRSSWHHRFLGGRHRRSSAGYRMLAQPVIGQSYRQEFAAGVAEDFAKVVSLKQAV